MAFIGFFAGTVYVLIALFSLYMTRQEHRWNQPRNRTHATLGYALCVFWPVMIALATACMMVRRKTA